MLIGRGFGWGDRSPPQPIQMPYQRPQTQAITIGAKPTNLTHGHWGDMGMVPKRFAPVQITKMDFHRRQGNTCDRIPQGNARVGISARIDQNSTVFSPGGMNSV